MCLLQILGLSLLLLFWYHEVVDQISYKLLLLQVTLSVRMQAAIIEVGYSNAILTFQLQRLEKWLIMVLQ
jgi:hypothetical protein